MPFISGAELSLLDIMKSLDRQRFDPVLVLPRPGPMAQQAQAAGIPVRYASIPAVILRRKRQSAEPPVWRSIGDLVLLVPAVEALCRAVRRERPRILYTNTLKAHLIGGIAGRLCGTAVIWHFRDIVGEPWLRRPMRLLARLLPHRIIAVSHAVAGQFEGPVRAKLTVVHNGIDPAAVRTQAAARQRRDILRELGLPARCRLVGTVGQIARWKGQDVFLRAAAEVAEKLPDTRFLVIGGPLFGEDDFFRGLLDLARSLGIGDRVRFTGQRADAYALMRQLALLAHCSVRPEPFGRVLLEAMALGVPVAASDGGAVREIITDPRQGIVFQPGDHQQLASAIIESLGNHPRAAWMAAAGRQRVLQFGIAATAAGVARVLARTARECCRG